MVEKNLYEIILKLIKPDCEKCIYNTEIFKDNKLQKECSKKECEYKVISGLVVNYLNKNYKIKKR